MTRWFEFLIRPLRNKEQKPEERRAVGRIHVPICPRCHSRGGVYVTARSLGAVHFTCRSCNEIIVLKKPNASASEHLSL